MKSIIKMALIGALSIVSVALADDPTQTQQAAPVVGDAGQILPGRPDAPVVNDLELGPEFRSMAAGIAFRPPNGGKEIRPPVGSDQIVAFVNDKEHWQLKATRLALSTPAPLTTDTEKNKDGILRTGMLEMSANQLKIDTGAPDILRQDFINVGNIPVGMIAVRYLSGTESKLTQRALVQADESLYYMIDFTTNAPHDGKLEDDPQTRAAVDLFNHIVESIKVLDQSQLQQDERDRLFITHAFYLNLTEPAMRAVLVPERWLRIIRDGKDIGYSYVIEEVASGLPHKGKDGKLESSTQPTVGTAGGNRGIRIGVRTRTYPEPGQQVDSETWSWVAMDHKQEEWSSVVSAQNAQDAGKRHITNNEFGMAIWRLNEEPGDVVPLDGKTNTRPPETYKLTVTSMNSAQGLSKPVELLLPPYYLPKAVDHLLPRLLPRLEPKGFMFATYVSDQKGGGQLIRRYIDVGKEGPYTLDGKEIHAVPVEDRIGLEGSITTHYISPEGQYLGSVNEDDKLTIVPTDQATLVKLWKDANLTRPGEVETPATQPAQSR